jgi:hypothetical protein
VVRGGLESREPADVVVRIASSSIIAVILVFALFACGSDGGAASGSPSVEASGSGTPTPSPSIRSPSAPDEVAVQLACVRMFAFVLQMPDLSPAEVSAAADEIVEAAEASGSGELAAAAARLRDNVDAPQKQFRRVVLSMMNACSALGWDPGL